MRNQLHGLDSSVHSQTVDKLLLCSLCTIDIPTVLCINQFKHVYSCKCLRLGAGHNLIYFICIWTFNSLIVVQYNKLRDVRIIPVLNEHSVHLLI